MEEDEEFQIEIENKNEKMIKENKRTKYILNQTGKQIVSNVFKYFKKTMNTSMAVTKTAKATGVSESMIYRVKKERETNTLQSPKKRGRKPKKPIEQMTVCDELTIYGIRKLFNEFSRQNISPSLNVLLAAIKNDDKLQDMSRTSLHRLLKKLGFNYITINKKTILTEHYKIIKFRHDYLRQIKKYREGGRPIVCTDETWITIGGSLNQSNCTIKNTENYKVMETIDEKKSSSIKRLKSKALKSSTRFILIHAGGYQGLIKEAGHHFLCKKSVVDALYELDDEKYEKWFEEKLLPNTPVGCVIVLDNASYHTRILNNNNDLKSNSKKDKQKKYDIIDNNNDNEKFSFIPFKEKKSELDYLDEENNKKLNVEYRIDLLAKESGRTILRLPPYHCELNPMEMIWNRIKQEILNENFCSITEIYDKITLEDWNNYVIQVKNIEQDIWTRERIRDSETDTDYKNSIFLENYQNDFV